MSGIYPLDSTRKCTAFAIALACSASLVSAQAVDPGPPVSSVMGSEVPRPRRLPSVVRPSAGLTYPGLTDQGSGATGSASVWKTKMAFERLDFQTAREASYRRPSSDLEKCSAESSASAVRLRGEVTTLNTEGSLGEVRWLRTNSASACVNKARRLIDQALLEYGTRAWLSAEATAWEALRCAAESVDLMNRESPKVQLGIHHRNATKRLQTARTAIREARDFSGIYGNADGEAISRMVVSHTTDVLKNIPCDSLSGNDASDRYLDAARVCLAGIASTSTEAARSMDLLAAIYLQQGDSKKLHGATALCLRRAALQGQPNNASLASRLGMHLLDLGLINEASWALKHSLSLEKDQATTQAYIAALQRSGRQTEATQVLGSFQPDQRSNGTSGPRIPTITELSPREFAAISKSVMTAPEGDRSKASFAIARAPVSIQPQPVAVRRNEPRDPNIVPQHSEKPATASKPNVFQRFIGSVKKMW